MGEHDDPVDGIVGIVDSPDTVDALIASDRARARLARHMAVGALCLVAIGCVAAIAAGVPLATVGVSGVIASAAVALGALSARPPKTTRPATDRVAMTDATLAWDGFGLRIEHLLCLDEVLYIPWSELTAVVVDDNPGRDFVRRPLGVGERIGAFVVPWDEPTRPVWVPDHAIEALLVAEGGKTPIRRWGGAVLASCATWPNLLLCFRTARAEVMHVAATPEARALTRSIPIGRRVGLRVTDPRSVVAAAAFHGVPTELTTRLLEEE